MKNVYIQARISEELKQEATELAPEKNLSLLVRQLLREFVEKNK